MRYLVEKINPYTEREERVECRSAWDAGIQANDLWQPIEALDVTEALWRGEEPSYVDEETGDEITVTRLHKIEPLRIKLGLDTRGRAAVRALRTVREALRPGWIEAEEPAFSFPIWRVTRRPFDWMVDQADIPAPDPARAPYPEQARLWLYLRPPAAVVRAA